MSSVRLRPLVPEDAPTLAVLCDNRRIWDNLRDFIPSPYSLEDAEAFIALCQADCPQLNFAIEAEGQLVGVVGLVPGVDIHRCSAELGYWIGEPYWGRGYASEAARLMTAYGFEQLGLVRIFAGVFDYNKASQRVLEKAGYRLCCVLERAVIKNGRILDEWHYAQLAPEPSVQGERSQH